MSEIRLTEHFLLSEFLYSDTAKRLGIDNKPIAQSYYKNLQRTAILAEKVRLELGSPMLITSGYRCPKLNRAVGGASNSSHLEGNAIDFICPRFGAPKEIIKFIINHTCINFDQLIYEGTWVHLGAYKNDGSQRKEVLTYKNGLYIKGLV